MLIKPPLIVIVGPTSSGKSALSLELAEEFHGEIVSADSRQIYRGMNVGTNKPTPEEQARVPHHLLDVAEPDSTYTVAEFKEAALSAIRHIHARNKLPFLVGGTGLYVQVVVDNLDLPNVPPQQKLRQELELLTIEQLRTRLKACDPVGAEKIDLHNRRRIIRAIEVSETAGVPFSDLRKAGTPEFDPLMLGVYQEPEVMRQRLRISGQWRLDHGILEEMQRLNSEGISWDQFESFGLEYRRYAQYFEGKLGLVEASELAQKDLFAFAKRQITWFKRDKRIRWISTEDNASAIVSDWLMQRAEEPVRA